MAVASHVSQADSEAGSAPYPTAMTTLARAFAWAVVATTFAYVLSSYLTYWWRWPGVPAILEHFGVLPGSGPALTGGALALGLIQGAFYVLSVLGAWAYAARSATRPLRADAESISEVAAFVVRTAYWAVLLVGVADVVISFLRVEDLLKGIVGDHLASELGRSQFRGLYVHTPLLVVSVIIAAFTRGVSFVWLALLVVAAEMQIVVTRFIFSYEQAFMGDIVRFWYAALFLLASAYTLREEGHVRVDVLYAGFHQRTKGRVNMLGSVLLGIIFCWIVLYLGTASRSSVIVGPLLTFEVSQSGFGMYVKYLMAALLGIFAISMMIQFASYLLDSYADARGEPGGRQVSSEIAH